MHFVPLHTVYRHVVMPRRAYMIFKRAQLPGSWMRCHCLARCMPPNRRSHTIFETTRSAAGMHTCGTARCCTIHTPRTPNHPHDSTGLLCHETYLSAPHASIHLLNNVIPTRTQTKIDTIYMRLPYIASTDLPCSISNGQEVLTVLLFVFFF